VENLQQTTWVEAMLIEPEALK